MRALIVAVLAVFILGFGYSPVNASDGKTVYDAKCKMCHAVDGKGNPAMAKMFKVDPGLLDLTTAKNQKRSDTELSDVVRKGQGTMKPIAAEKVCDADLKLVVSHVRVLQKGK